MILKNSEKKENNWFEFTVESDGAEFEEAIKKAYLKNKNQINIPGFRKGKAPLAVIEGMYGPEVFYQDALDELAQDAFEAGIQEGNINFIGVPSITAADVTEARTAVFTFSVELYPEVELGEYKGLEVEEVSTDVTDDEVNAEVESVRKRNARKVSVDDREAKLGDIANIDYEGFLDAEKTNPFDGGKGENHELELGSGSFVPGFEDQVVGMKVGEEKDINITFPEQYAEELAGKDVVFHVKVNGITYPELPELDDDFAQDVSEFDTLKDYLSDVKAKLFERKSEQAKSAIRNEALLKACDNMKAEVPETMIKSHIDAIIRNFANNYGLSDPKMSTETIASMLGIDEETMNTAIRPNAVNESRLELLVNAIIDKEKIEATEEALEEYVAKVSEKVGATVDEIKKYFGMDYIVSEFKKEKAMEIVADSAVPVKAKKTRKSIKKAETEESEKPAKKTSKKAEKIENVDDAEKPAKKTTKKSTKKTETEEEK
ncbi:MAG: trigger factor [Eubacteriales bacterium]|nr:trigger factor [Eubacteriales bacterium]